MNINICASKTHLFTKNKDNLAQKSMFPFMLKVLKLPGHANSFLSDALYHLLCIVSLLGWDVITGVHACVKPAVKIFTPQNLARYVY